MFSIDKVLFNELAKPMEGNSSRIDSAKIRRLYLQAGAQQWIPTEKLDFYEPVLVDDRQARVWREFMTIFYTLEKMGLNVLDNMMGKAVRKLRSDDVAFYLSLQCADEARHVFLIEQYLKKLGAPPAYEKKYLVLGQLASMGAYRVENWLFSTLFSENFASTFLKLAEKSDMDPFGKKMCKAILFDEHRHVHFLYLVLPEVTDQLSFLGRKYVQSAQYFIMKFTERISASLAKDGKMVGIDRRELLEETFENVAKAYSAFGIGRNFLKFPAIH